MTFQKRGANYAVFDGSAYVGMACKHKAWTTRGTVTSWFTRMGGKTLVGGFPPRKEAGQFLVNVAKGGQQ